MAAYINTNVASLNSQRNLNSSQASLNTALQRLSSGLRINSSKDDAAGLAIADRMTSQINGLTQAGRNANDGISLAQTAEGALSSIGDSLQRIRTLALQSANSTNSASDRASLNLEVQSALAEIGRISSTTQFNGLNLLDGSFSQSQFQVGANANQTISMTIAGASTSLLGSFGGTSARMATNGSTAAAWDASTNNISIEGVNIGASTAQPGTAGWTAGSAAAKAAAINAASTQTGVTATASTSLSASAPTGNQALANGELLVNGVAVGAIAAGVTAAEQGANAAAAINLKTAEHGVSASYSSVTGALTLSAADGRDIKLASATGDAAAATKIQGATGLSVTDGTAATTGGTTLALTVADQAAATAMNGESFSLNGVTFSFSAAATGVTGTNAVNISTAATANANTLRDSIAAAFNAAKGDARTSSALSSLSVDASTAGSVTFNDSRVGANATLSRYSDSTITGIAATHTGADVTGATAFNQVTSGTIELSSSKNFTLTGNGTGLADAGMSALIPSLTQLGSVSVTSVTDSNSAIKVIDAALAQVNSQRASLGAMQNRFTSAISNLQTSSENISAARSRIQDTDFAAETASLTRAQILQQAGTAMLAQANSLPNGVLALLRG